MDLLSPEIIEKIVKLDGFDKFRDQLEKQVQEAYYYLEENPSKNDIRKKTAGIGSSAGSIDESENEALYSDDRLDKLVDALRTMYNLEDVVHNKFEPTSGDEASYEELYNNIKKFKKFAGGLEEFHHKDDMDIKMCLSYCYLDSIEEEFNNIKPILKNEGKDISFIDNFNSFCRKELKDLRPKKMTPELALKLGRDKKTVEDILDKLDDMRKAPESHSEYTGDVMALKAFQEGLGAIRKMNAKMPVNHYEKGFTEVNNTLTYLTEYLRNNIDDKSCPLSKFLEKFHKELAEQKEMKL